MTGKLNEAIEFQPIGIAVMTISDTRKKENDKSGDVLKQRLIDAGHKLISRTIVHDDIVEIQSMVKTWSADPEIDCIITTGGTGLTGRDVTPEAMRGLFDKEIEGFGEMFRWLSHDKIGTSALQSRAIAGVTTGTYVFSLPGSPSACKDGWDMILRWQLDIRHLPCNFVEIMPRLMESGFGGRQS